MIGERTRAGVGSGRVVTLRGDDGWDSGAMLIADTHLRRRRGIAPAPGPFGVIFHARSVHGLGLNAAVRWIGLDHSGVVKRCGLLRPRRVVLAPRSVRWVLEIPEWLPPPRLGVRLRVIPILAVWPVD